MTTTASTIALPNIPPGSLAPIPKPSPELAAMGDWYHNFDRLGVHVPQIPTAVFQFNQMCKEPILMGYLQIALAKSRATRTDRPSLLELFCADGYYSCQARRLGAGSITGIDLDPAALAKANAMFAALFGESNIFLQQDVFTYKPPAPVDILLNCGGLYHVTEPRRLIAECRPRFGARFMVVQSVVTMESTAEDYFITPAPEWRHGCRFTPAFLRKAILDAGWNILDSHFNELEGNERPCDRGSAYFLCQYPSGQSHIAPGLPGVTQPNGNNLVE